MFEKNLNIGYLLDFYGELLTDRKREVLDYYYNDDLSLSEITEEIGISRQGVRDIIKKAEEELLFFEEKLHLAGRFSDAEKQIRRIEELVRVKAPDAFGEVKAELDALAEKLKSF